MSIQDTRYVALLRGINVGGNNIIKMIELKACFEDLGLQEVVTHIQSGNVLFRASTQTAAELTDLLQDELSQKFSYKSRVVVLSYQELKDVVESAPRGFGKRPLEYKYDVLFLMPPLTAKEAIQQIKPKEGVDNVYPGKGVLYFSRLSEKASQSRMSRIIALPIYQSMTIRNWNTTSKLLALMK